MKQLLRMAELKTLQVLPKRCRNFRFDHLEATGIDDEEAITNLKTKYDALLSKCKEARFKEIFVFDVEVDRGFITRPIYPECSAGINFKRLTPRIFEAIA